MAIFELPFNLNEIPIEKRFEIDDTNYSYLVQKNEQKDFFTVTIKDENDGILLTSKLLYNGDLLHAGRSLLSINSKIIPFDDTGTYDTVNAVSFDTVKILEVEQ